MIATTTLTARLLAAAEQLPAPLRDGFTDSMPGGFDPNWVWVVEDGDSVCGMIIASPCHGVVLLLRVKMSDGAPATALTTLLRKLFADVRARGYFGYMTFLGISDTEKRLMRLVRRTSGLVVASPMVAVAAPLPPEGM